MILAPKRLQLLQGVNPCPLDPRGSFTPLTIYPGVAPACHHLVVSGISLTQTLLTKTLITQTESCDPTDILLKRFHHTKYVHCVISTQEHDHALRVHAATYTVSLTHVPINTSGCILISSHSYVTHFMLLMLYMLKHKKKRKKQTYLLVLHK